MLVDLPAPVLSNTRLSAHYNVVALEAPAIARAARPGQFVMVKPAPGFEPLLRRPFSIFEIVRDAAGTPLGISILSKAIGITTRQIYALAPGDTVPCLGPLGRPFSMPGAGQEAWMIAGGVGLAPFVTLAETLREHGRPATLFYGGRSRDDLFYLDLFEGLGVRLVLATEDGSRGERGRITIPLDRALGEARDADVMLYACGPEPMLAAVAHLAARHERSCEVSVERVMGCGLGGCYSCVVPALDAEGHQHFVRSCVGGPVFDAASLVWE
jgi:dihydroorotate dehydrogenase electron transfer subunit